MSKVQAGDEVILGWIKSAGLEAAGARYRCDDQLVNSGKVTTFSNYTVVSESRLVRKPQALSLKEAVLFGCALPTGCGMVFNEAKPDPETNVAVLGLGGVGLSALMALKTFSLKCLIAIDLSDIKLALAREMGATHTCNPSRDDVAAIVRQVTDGGVDLCIESCGSVETIEFGFSIIKCFGGRLLFASHPADGETIRLAPFDLISGKQISGSWGGASIPDSDIPATFARLRDSNIPLECLVKKEYKLEQVNDALDDLGSGRAFRPIVKMEHD